MGERVMDGFSTDRVSALGSRFDSVLSNGESGSKSHDAKVDQPGLFLTQKAENSW